MTFLEANPTRSNGEYTVEIVDGIDHPILHSRHLLVPLHEGKDALVFISSSS
jgi:hypothetical protein